MSDNIWEDDEQYESNAMRVLREKAENDSKLIREMSEELKALRRERQAESLSKAAKEKGLDPSVVKLAEKAGYALDEQGLEGFLKDFGALVAKPAPAAQEDETDVPDEDVVPSDEQAVLSGIASSASGAQPKAGLDALEAQIKSADSQESLLKLLGVTS